LAILLSVRLINLLTVSFIFFHAINPEEIGDGLEKIGIPYVVVFILTTAMRYVPLIGLQIRNIIRSYLKKVFSPDIGVEPSPQVLDILKYACGLSLGFALISNENPNFEMASSVQQSRGIDLRPRLKNAVNFMALLMPLLVQSFLMSDELAMAMETRGFGCKGRSSRRKYRLMLMDWGLLTAGLTFLLIFFWWERG